MDNTAVLKSIRRMVMFFGALLIVTILVAGTNIYLTLAAPLSSLTAPTTVAFEGYLADGSGTPLSGAHSITFRLYGAASGGTALWTETHSSVTVSDGLYSVQLGSAGSPLDADDFSTSRWLSVQVDSNAEMSPRIAMSAVPWSFNAVQAQKTLSLQGYEVADTAPSEGNALIWNDTTDLWEPQGVSGDATSLLGRPLDDQATPTAGQGLTWNGTNWSPQTPPTSVTTGGVTYSMQKLETNTKAYWYPAPPLGAANINAAAATLNQVRVWAVRIESPLHLTKFTTFVGTSSNTKHLGFGFYDLSGNKICSAVATLTATNNTAYSATLASPCDLAPGVYYFAWTSDLAGITIDQYTGNVVHGRNINTGGIVRLGTAANASSAGVLPATLGTLTAVNNQHVAFVIGE